MVKAGVCKTLIVGSIPTVASNLSDTKTARSGRFPVGLPGEQNFFLASAHGGEPSTGDRQGQPKNESPSDRWDHHLIIGRGRFVSLKDQGVL